VTQVLQGGVNCALGERRDGVPTGADVPGGGESPVWQHEEVVLTIASSMMEPK
jgi:hypothetical protein